MNTQSLETFAARLKSCGQDFSQLCAQFGVTQEDLDDTLMAGLSEPKSSEYIAPVIRLYPPDGLVRFSETALGACI